METNLKQIQKKLNPSNCKVGKRYCKESNTLCDPEAERFLDRCTICNKPG
jgi:nitrogenase molybdenum-iron protein alpha/beta subunit